MTKVVARMTVVVLSQMIADDTQCIIYVNNSYVRTPVFTRLIPLIHASKPSSTRANACVHTRRSTNSDIDVHTYGLANSDGPYVCPHVHVRPGTLPHAVHMAEEGASNDRVHPGPGAMAVHTCGQGQKSGTARASHCPYARPYVVRTRRYVQGHSPMLSIWLRRGQAMIGCTQVQVQWLSTRADKGKRVARHGPHTVHTPVHTSSVRIGTSRDTSPCCPYG